MWTCVSTRPAMTTESPASKMGMPAGTSSNLEIAMMTPWRMWIAAGPGSFASDDKTLRPRTIRSGVAMFGKKLAQKFFQEILRHATTIVRRRAHVVNRRNFAGELVASSPNQGVVEALASKRGFGSSGAQDSGSNASKRDARISNLAPVAQCNRSKTDFRDGLRAAGAHL